MTINAELLSLKNDIAAALDGGHRNLGPDAAQAIARDVRQLKGTLEIVFSLGQPTDGHDFGEQHASEIIPDQERLLAEVEAKAWRR